MKCPLGAFIVRPVSLACRSTISISAKRILSSYPDAVGIPDTIISSTSFSAFSANFLLLVSSSRSSEDEMSLLAKDSRNYNTGFVSRLSHAGFYATYNLELVLPEFLLLGLVEEGKVSNMMYKYIAEEREL